MPGVPSRPSAGLHFQYPESGSDTIGEKRDHPEGNIDADEQEVLKFSFSELTCAKEVRAIKANKRRRDTFFIVYYFYTQQHSQFREKNYG